SMSEGRAQGHHNGTDRSDQSAQDRRDDEEAIRTHAVHARLASAVGVPTREYANASERSSLAGNTDASNAFLPRRVASSETATKAMSRRTAHAVRRPATHPEESAALHSADAEHALGHRSGKLAMFFSYARHAQRTSPLSGIGSAGAIPEL